MSDRLSSVSRCASYAGAWIEPRNLPRRQRGFQIGHVERQRATLFEQRFDAPGIFGQGAAAAGAFRLDAVIARRIVAGRDHHAACRLFVFYRKRHDRRGRIGAAQIDQ